MNRSDIEIRIVTIETYGVIRHTDNPLPIRLKQEILDEFDRLTAEVERLRWHYPERGEFPDSNVGIIYEVSVSATPPDEWYRRIGYFWNGNFWCVDERKTLAALVEKWRYVD